MTYHRFIPPNGQESESLAILLKSYSRDFEYAERLVRSFEVHNPEGISLYCVVPTVDLEQFRSLESEFVTVISEEPLAQYFTTAPVHGLRAGYINQEIVKLSFWELGLATNYFCIDSDAIIIRDLHITDFVSPDGYPYTVLVEDNDLKSEPRYFREHWRSREAAIARIAQEVGFNSSVVLTCHGHQIFSGEVLRSFFDEFLKPREWSYLDALACSPYEFSWYNLWLQTSKGIPIHPREPLVKVLHHEGHYLEHVLRGISVEDLARGYIAVVVNSNFSRSSGLVNLELAKPRALARFLSYTELAQLAWEKVRYSLSKSGNGSRGIY